MYFNSVVKKILPFVVLLKNKNKKYEKVYYVFLE